MAIEVGVVLMMAHLTIEGLSPHRALNRGSSTVFFCGWLQPSSWIRCRVMTEAVCEVCMLVGHLPGIWLRSLR